MDNIAIIGASYLQLPLINKAKEMGYVTHVFAWAVNDVGEKAADYFYPISIVEKELIAEKCSEIGIVGICSIASDLAIITVNYVAKQLGLVGNDLKCTLNSTNKLYMRNVFKANNDPCPWYMLVDEGTELSLIPNKFPVIVKPLDRSGSRGINKVERLEDLKPAIKAAIDVGFVKQALIEEFVSGEEYSVESISYMGEHYVIALTKKYTTGPPHFIETGHAEPADVSPQMYEKIKNIVIHALTSLGIRNGASHAEIKIQSDGTVKIIEIGGRMGGDCIGSDLVQFSTGIDYVQAVIQVACGKKPDLSIKSRPIPVEVRFIFSQKDIEEMEQLRNENKLLKTVALFPQNIGTTTDSSNRGGCFIFRK